MEFDLSTMNQVARELLAGVETDAALLRAAGHRAAADRAVRRVERMTDLAADVTKLIGDMPDGPGLVLHAAIDHLERNLTAPVAGDTAEPSA